MPTAIARGDKTKFVNEFLAKNPQGNLRAVNEAWTAEGMRGTISKSVVDKIRAKLGLTGNLRCEVQGSRQAEDCPQEDQEGDNYSWQSRLHQRVSQRSSRCDFRGSERGVDEGWDAGEDQPHYRL